MQTPFTNPAFRPDAAFTHAAEQFFELLKTFGLPAAGPLPGGAGSDWSNLAGPLAGQFAQWLKGAQSTGPWFVPPGAASPGLGAALGPGFAAALGAGFGAAPAGAFGPLPLGAGAVPQQDAQRSWELVTRLTQLQGQLAAHWQEIAVDAAQRFVGRAGAHGRGAPTLDSALKLYELWVSCAEESYGAAVRKEEFCRLQAELANASAALLVEQRRHAESLARAFGLPSRSEVDALYAQLKELRRELAELAEAPRAPPRSRAAAQRRRTRKRRT
jgi:poly(hydroxyalkanoate) synthase III subunit E